MRMFKELQKTWNDEVKRHQLMESLQVCFVAVVWIALFALVLIVQGCAEKPKEAVRPENLKDMEIKEPTTLSSSEYLIVNRLIFARGGRLITNGLDLRIEANEIISDEGVIEPFGLDNAAPPGQAGLSGGNISVKSKSGRGALFIYGRGQNGGAGVNGLPGVVGKPGQDGKGGLTTCKHVDVLCTCAGIATDLREQMKGNIFLALFAQQQWIMHRARHRCISETGDGYPGKQGSTGTAGGNGGKGGDSARILVEIENPSSLQVKAYPLPGQGGIGGSGGPGGDGGRGGAPGNHTLDWFENCREAAAGPKGAPGDRGLPGLTEVSGSNQPLCIKLGTTSFGDCEKFNAQ
jgi:hypothetical protein